MTDPKSWQCPYCGYRQISTENNRNPYYVFANSSELFDKECWVLTTTCLNPECKKVKLRVVLGDIKGDYARYENEYVEDDNSTKVWDLLPGSMAKPQPEYIPEPIRNDYEEACKIANLSPKAAATLARRCLQGMIRDFCEIKKETLYQEIEELKKKFNNNAAPQGVTTESIEAIDNVRKMGNIGAHMEFKDDVVVNIDPKEATMLIGLIDMLFKEWYIARHERDERLQKIKEMTENKVRQEENKAE